MKAKAVDVDVAIITLFLVLDLDKAVPNLKKWYYNLQFQFYTNIQPHIIAPNDVPDEKRWKHDQVLQQRKVHHKLCTY